jgi:hypothetical protein
LFPWFDALKTTIMVEPCHLSFNVSHRRIIGVVGGTGHDGGGEKRDLSFLL